MAVTRKILRVVSAETNCRQYRERMREAIRKQAMGLKPADPEHYRRAILTDQALVAKMPSLLPRCTVCRTATWQVVLVGREKLCGRCLELATAMLKEPE